jgi:coatomer subunit beta'
MHSSQAPKAVQAWKSELTSKKRTKIAATIADPSSNPELFEEGWEEVLAREEAHGRGTFLLLFLFLMLASDNAC